MINKNWTLFNFKKLVIFFHKIYSFQDNAYYLEKIEKLDN